MIKCVSFIPLSRLLNQTRKIYLIWANEISTIHCFQCILIPSCYFKGWMNPSTVSLTEPCCCMHRLLISAYNSNPGCWEFGKCRKMAAIRTYIKGKQVACLTHTARFITDPNLPTPFFFHADNGDLVLDTRHSLPDLNLIKHGGSSDWSASYQAYWC